MLKVTEIINVYLLNNKQLIYFLLQSIKDCIPEKYLDKYAKQIDCITKVQWVLGVEVDFFFENDETCKNNLIPEWEEEKKIAEIVITDINNKKYRLKFFVVKGHIFSIESNLPFRYLRVSQIKDLQVVCEK